MIEKIEFTKTIDSSLFTVLEIDNLKLVNTINEIIDKVNDIDIKLQTVKCFIPESDEASKKLLDLLEKDNSVGDIIQINEKK